MFTHLYHKPSFAATEYRGDKYSNLITYNSYTCSLTLKKSTLND